MEKTTPISTGPVKVHKTKRESQRDRKPYDRHAKWEKAEALDRIKENKPPGFIPGKKNPTPGRTKRPISTPTTDPLSPSKKQRNQLAPDKLPPGWTPGREKPNDISEITSKLKEILETKGSVYKTSVPFPKRCRCLSLSTEQTQTRFFLVKSDIMRITPEIKESLRFEYKGKGNFTDYMTVKCVLEDGSSSGLNCLVLAFDTKNHIMYLKYLEKEQGKLGQYKSPEDLIPDKTGEFDMPLNGTDLVDVAKAFAKQFKMRKIMLNDGSGYYANDDNTDVLKSLLYELLASGKTYYSKQGFTPTCIDAKKTEIKLKPSLITSLREMSITDFINGLNDDAKAKFISLYKDIMKTEQDPTTLDPQPTIGEFFSYVHKNRHTLNDGQHRELIKTIQSDQFLESSFVKKNYFYAYVYHRMQSPFVNESKPTTTVF